MKSTSVKVTLVASVFLGMLGCSDEPDVAADYANTGNAGVGTAGTEALAGSGASGTGAAGVDANTAGMTAVIGTAGSSGEGGAAGTTSQDVDGGLTDSDATVPGDKPKCLEKDSQVVVLGDSYINWVSHTMPDDLKKVSGQSWRMHAIGAASMGSGGASFIPDQLTTAIDEDPDMKVIVMTGGGNDILVPDSSMPGSGDCKMRADSPTLPVCQMIVQKAIDKAIELMDDVADQGVTDVIYFFYPEVPEGTLIGGTHPRAMLRYALPKVRATCEEANMRTGGKMTCHFIDTIPLFKDHDDWFAPTDIHENSLGSMAIAKEIWKLMQDECIAQKSPNTCCEN